MTDSVAEGRTAEMAFPWWVTLVQGIAALVIGGLLLIQPKTTIVVLIQFLGWFWLIGGVFELIGLFWNHDQWGWKVFSGLLGVVLGGYIIGAPLMGALAVLGGYALFLGIGGIVVGIADVVKAFQGAGWGKGILGAFSILFGLFIAFNLLPAALALPWVFGVLGIVFGVAAIVMSFQIKKLQA